MTVEDRNQPHQRLEKRPVEGVTRICRPKRPIVVEDDQTGVETSYSNFSLVTLVETLSVKNAKTLPRFWRLSFTR